jgi:predicted P-loop ATPase
MLVLESGQGKDKSSALEVMAVIKEWFSDSMPLSADNKQVIESLTGKLIVECADLHGLKNSSVDHVKALLSRSVDRARMAYGRLPIERPRQNVFIGTANNRDYLRDKTGNRRFWPVAVKTFDLDGLRRDRDQLWGEAAAREMAGQSIRLDRSLWEAAGAEQRKRTDTVSDPYTEALRNVLAEMEGKLAAEDVWKILGLTVAGQRSQVHNERLGAAMRYLGWQRRSIKVDGKKRSGYVKGPQPFRRIAVARHVDGEVVAAFEGEEDDIEC